MNIKLIIFISIACMLVLASCTGESDGTGPDLTSPFIGGNVGLNAYLLEGLPPPIIQDNGQSVFTFAVVLENLGESKVTALTRSTPTPYVIKSIILDYR